MHLRPTALSHCRLSPWLLRISGSEHDSSLVAVRGTGQGRELVRRAVGPPPAPPSSSLAHSLASNTHRPSSDALWEGKPAALLARGSFVPRHAHAPLANGRRPRERSRSSRRTQVSLLPSCFPSSHTTLVRFLLSCSPGSRSSPVLSLSLSLVSSHTLAQHALFPSPRLGRPRHRADSRCRIECQQGRVPVSQRLPAERGPDQGLGALPVRKT